MRQALPRILCAGLAALSAVLAQAPPRPVHDTQGREFQVNEDRREQRDGYAIVRLSFPSPVRSGHPADRKSVV